MYFTWAVKEKQDPLVITKVFLKCPLTARFEVKLFDPVIGLSARTQFLRFFLKCEILFLQKVGWMTWRAQACLSHWLLDVIVSKLKWTVCLQSFQSLRDGHQSSPSIIPGLKHTVHQQSWADLNDSKSHCAVHNKKLLSTELQVCD